MKPKTQAYLLMTVGGIAGLALFAFMWWFSGEDLPRERGANAVTFVFFSLIVVFVGAWGAPLLCWSWFYDRFFLNKK